MLSPALAPTRLLATLRVPTQPLAGHHLNAPASTIAPLSQFWLPARYAPSASATMVRPIKSPGLEPTRLLVTEMTPLEPAAPSPRATAPASPIAPLSQFVEPTT